MGKNGSDRRHRDHEGTGSGRAAQRRRRDPPVSPSRADRRPHGVLAKLLPAVAVLSFRLGGADGVSVAAAQWVAALRRMGCRVGTVAGSGSADRIVPGLGSDASRPPRRDELASALRCADLVVVENVCSLPMNPAATDAVAGALRDRRAVLRHHDLPWERERYAHLDGWPPDAPGWQHVAISRHSAAELARRGIDAVALYPGYADVPGSAIGRRRGGRSTSRPGNGCCCSPPGPSRARTSPPGSRSPRRWERSSG